MTDKTKTDYVDALLQKAAETSNPEHAMKLTQAALNAANALCTVATTPRRPPNAQ